MYLLQTQGLFVQAATVADLDCLPGHTGGGAFRLDQPNDVHALHDATKYDMLSIQSEKVTKRTPKDSETVVSPYKH